MGDHPVLPDYAGACITNVVHALLERPDAVPAWLPANALADQVVLLVVDGLGWEQLEQRRHLAPTLSAMEGGPITTVAPSTTAAALTSITTGMAPGDHGLIGYRMAVHGEVLNVLRWTTASGDARHSLPPHKVQPHLAFLGQHPPIVTKAEFASSAFSGAHLEGTRFNGYRTTSTLVTEVRRLVRGGEPFVYAYYEGLDKVSHEYGLGEHYDAELVAVDRLASDLLAALPPRAALVLVSDHGQVEVGERVMSLPSDVLAHVSMQSGEGRFRWLHSRPGRATAMLDAATDHLGEHAWVVTRDDVLLEGWFGPHVSDDARTRLGDVALVARDDVAFDDPHDTGPYHLVGRHGSMTAAEVYVPLLVGVAR